MKRKAGKRLKSTGTPKTTSPSTPGASSVTLAFDAPKEVRAIARERLGPVKPAQAILPKTDRKKPKHKKKPGEEQD